MPPSKPTRAVRACGRGPDSVGAKGLVEGGSQALPHPRLRVPVFGCQKHSSKDSAFAGVFPGLLLVSPRVLVLILLLPERNASFYCCPADGSQGRESTRLSAAPAWSLNSSGSASSSSSLRVGISRPMKQFSDLAQFLCSV